MWRYSNQSHSVVNNGRNAASNVRSMIITFVDWSAAVVDVEITGEVPSRQLIDIREILLNTIVQDYDLDRRTAHVRSRPRS